MTAPRAVGDIKFDVCITTHVLDGRTIVLVRGLNDFIIHSRRELTDNECLIAIQDWYERVERRKRETLAEEL